MRKIMSLLIACVCFCMNVAAQEQPDKDRQAKIAKALKDLRDKDAIVRGFAAMTLAEMEAKQYAKEVVQLLNDKDALVKKWAAIALGSMHANEYARDVVKLLKDKEAGVRESAAEALGEMKAKEYAKDVAALLKDMSMLVRISSVEALGRMNAKEFANDIASLLSDTETGDVYDEQKKAFMQKTVGTVAKQVLKDWGIDPDKLRQNEKEEKK